MKKWLIRCLTVLAMVCLIPGIALNAKAVAYAFTYCIQCKADKTCDILGYVWQSNADPIYHKIRIKCQEPAARRTRSFINSFRIIPAAPKPPPAPQAKSVAYAGRNMAFSVTHGASGHPPATARTSASCTRSNCDAVELQTVPCGGDSNARAPSVCGNVLAEGGTNDGHNDALEQHAAKAPTCTEMGWDAYEHLLPL